MRATVAPPTNIRNTEDPDELRGMELSENSAIHRAPQGGLELKARSLADTLKKGRTTVSLTQVQIVVARPRFDLSQLQKTSRTWMSGRDRRHSKSFTVFYSLDVSRADISKCEAALRRRAEQSTRDKERHRMLEERARSKAEAGQQNGETRHRGIAAPACGDFDAYRRHTDMIRRGCIRRG